VMNEHARRRVKNSSGEWAGVGSAACKCARRAEPRKCNCPEPEPGPQHDTGSGCDRSDEASPRQRPMEQMRPTQPVVPVVRAHLMFRFHALLPNQSSSFVPVRGVRLDTSVRSFPPLMAACRRRVPHLLKREIRQFWIIARRPTLRTPALIVDDQVLRSGRKYLQRLQKLDHVIALL